MSPITLVLSSLMVLIGLAMIVRAIAAGGGPLAVGIVLGLLFVAAGAGRIYAERCRSPRVRTLISRLSAPPSGIHLPALPPMGTPPPRPAAA